MSIAIRRLEAFSAAAMGKENEQPTTPSQVAADGSEEVSPDQWVTLWAPPIPQPQAPTEVTVDGVWYNVKLVSSPIEADSQNPWKDPEYPGIDRDHPYWECVMRKHILPDQPPPTWHLMFKQGHGEHAQEQLVELGNVRVYEWGKSVPVVSMGPKELAKSKEKPFYANGLQLTIHETIDLSKPYYAIVDMRIDGKPVQLQTRKMELLFECDGPWGNETVVRPTPQEAVGKKAPDSFGEG